MSSEHAIDRSLKLLRFDSAAEFADATTPFLLEHEVQNGLMLGLTSQLVADPLTYGSPPYLALVRDRTAILAVGLVTPPWPLVISPVADVGAIAILATDLWQQHPTLPGVNGPSNEARTFASTWEQLTGSSAELATSMKIYRADTITQPHNVAGSLRRATAADRPLLIDWMGGFHTDVHQHSAEHETVAEDVDRRMHDPDSGWYLWDNGQPVSMVGYGGPTRTGIRIGPVYTPPAHRGHGYASAATAAVSQSLLDQGRHFCYLYTEASNSTSNKIYQAIGFRHVSDAAVYRF
jgi:predicted GNAT family acetyltransferase